MSHTKERPIEDLKYGNKVQAGDQTYVVETVRFDVVAPNGALVDVLVTHQSGWFAGTRSFTTHRVIVD